MLKNHLLMILWQKHLNAASYLIKSRHKIFKGIVLSVLGGKNWCWDGCFEAGKRPLAFWSAQVPGQEAKIVNRQDPSVNILFLLHQDAGDFLRELDEGLQVNQFLADPSWTWREGTGIGHRGTCLAFWNKATKIVVTPRPVCLITDIYLRAIQNLAGLLSKVSAWWIVLYYLSCSGDLISALPAPSCPLGGGAGGG